MSGGNRLYRVALGACLAALLLATPALSQQDVEKPTPAVNEGQGVAGEAPLPEEDSGENTEREQAPAADPLPPPLPIENETDAEPACGPRCEAAQQREKEDLGAQQDMARFAGDLVDLTFWQLVVGGTGISLLVVTLVLTVKATNAAVDANRIARESSERQLRAYVGFAEINLDWSQATKIVTNVKFINSGQTPAYGAQLFAKYSLGQDSIDFDQLPPEPSQTVADIAHNGRFNARLDSSAFTREVRDQAKTGRLPMFVWGTLKYNDTFGNPRKTSYRYRWDGSLGRLIATAEGNESD